MADNAPKYVVEIVGWDGVGVRSYAGEPSIRKLEFDSDLFQITEATSPGPSKLTISLRPEIASAIDGIAALTARVVALERMLDGTGTVTFARVITGFLSAPPTAPTRSLTIQVPGALAESYEDAIEMAWTTTDMTPAVKLGFFGGSPVVQQTIPAVSVLADDEAALEAYNIIERSP